MPEPNATSAQGARHSHFPMLEQFAAAPDFNAEIQALRREIAALREELSPSPSVILVGQRVMREFEQLRKI